MIKNMKTPPMQAYPIYPAVFNLIATVSRDVSLPDFPGCVTFGRTFGVANNV